MNTLVTDTTAQHRSDVHEHPPQRRHDSERIQVRRVGLLDRLALHVGVALVSWGRRPLVVETRERRANRVEQRLALLERELAAERMQRLIAARL